MDQPVYLDCAATTAVDPRVAEIAVRVMTEEFGNAGSRTHLYGSRAKAVVEEARAQVASAIGCETGDVIFTSGATEANNIAILGALEAGPTKGRQHVITSAIEHKSVLEPFQVLERRGFDLTVLRPNKGGWIDESQVLAALREDTALISLMHVNNETGVVQPIKEIANAIQDHQVLFQVDAAQGFTKDEGIASLRRVDLVSLSGHKIHAPKGIGSLIVRSRQDRLPITPLMFGGGQERGVRPGTLPVHLIAALGKAAELGAREFSDRRTSNLSFRQNLIAALRPLEPTYLGDQSTCVPNIISLALPGIDSEAFILLTKDAIAISNGSACTSHKYEPSHVLCAMGVEEDIRQGAVRISWSHDSKAPDWTKIVNQLAQLI